MGDDLDMRREQELIHGHDAGDAIAAVDKDAKIARKRSGVAGEGNELRDLGSGKLLGLARRPGPRRIEHDGVIGRKLLGPEWRAEQVAGKGPNWLEPWRLARSLGESGKCGIIGLEGINRCGPRQGKGEGAKAGKKIRHTFGRSYSIAHKVDHRCFSFARGLQEGAGRKLHLHAREVDLGEAGGRDALPINSQARYAKRSGLPRERGQAAGTGRTPSTTTSRRYWFQ
jgi:hypothetical protein